MERTGITADRVPELGRPPPINLTFGQAEATGASSGWLDEWRRQREARPAWVQVLGHLTSAAGTAAGIYHGYKRNDSVGWALWWGFWGGAVPLLVLPLALAQGFAEPRKQR